MYRFSAVVAVILVMGTSSAQSDPYTWTGFYVGANIGGASGTFGHPFTVEVPGVFTMSENIVLNGSGAIGGLQAGYDHQIGRFVLGAEADFQWSGVNSHTMQTVTTPTGVPIALSGGTRLDWYGTVRAKGGIAVERVLIFGTAGYAYGQTTTSATATVAGTTASFSYPKQRSGYTLGGGAEYGLTEHISVRGEYAFVDFGNAPLTNSTILGATTTIRSDARFHLFRLGANFRF